VTVSHSILGDGVLQVFRALKDFFQGVWESQKASLAGPLIRAKMHNDDAMMLVAFGELLGFPFQSTFYSRLLFVPLMERIAPWQKRILKEQDVLECMND
jgi:hypothetical protein